MAFLMTFGPGLWCPFRLCFAIIYKLQCFHELAVLHRDWSNLPAAEGI
jgi:hypothetical protein